MGLTFNARTLSALRNQSVLITGGSGAFGSAYLAHCLEEGARRVVCYSRSESKQAELRSRFTDPRCRFLIGDVRDLGRLTEAMRGVDVVVHAAALKRVEICEEAPVEAVATNVTGTINVAKACVAAGVRRAVLLSTDKAAAPNTLYGATKACAEKLWIASNTYAAGTVTRFCATRYGNVLGSTGSVLPIWAAQVAAGAPVSVTDAKMTRFWMTMAEAVALVDFAFANMQGGETFVPVPVSSTVAALAAQYHPGWPVIELGSRPGEKLHETLITADEACRTYAWGPRFVIEPTVRTWGGEWVSRGVPVAPGFELRSDTTKAAA